MSWPYAKGTAVEVKIAIMILQDGIKYRKNLYSKIKVRSGIATVVVNIILEQM